MHKQNSASTSRQTPHSTSEFYEPLNPSVIFTMFMKRVFAQMKQDTYYLYVPFKVLRSDFLSNGNANRFYNYCKLNMPCIMSQCELGGVYNVSMC